MPRIAEARAGAEPSSPRQHERRRSILRAAEDIAAETGLDRVQMHEVARSAGVAIGTLYRYFPSKTHLFTAVMADQIEGLAARLAEVPARESPEDTVFATLAGATRSLLRRPALATAMIQSANVARASTVPDLARVDTGFLDLLIRAWGVEDPTEHHVARLRLLTLLWYGVLQSRLNERITPEEAEADLRMACRLLLAPGEDDGT
ncbi:TetR family transcriptional regulator [Streptomyces sp. S399]|uniref:TetR family transcriptional regulator n=1 Tax=Streptomyces TaxID=1883 RepID=UPI002A805B3F|nr:TetR family transcriptional regulator [Streptomyces sp. S399]WPR49825.1 TetR family transcriptional regulator [Streptomyces sp. S399]WSU39254.1 TetR family transcriptional regulator [Streptomyces gougerotii]